MSKAKTLLKRHATTVKELIVASLAYYAFWHYLEFTQKQAAVLAVMVLLLLSLALRAEKPGFEPFFIRIEPRWVHILRDLALVREDEWPGLRAALDESEKAAYNLFRDGIAVTVLGPNLYFSNNHKIFFTQLDLAEPMRELLPLEERQRVLSTPPMLRVKRALEKRPKSAFINCIRFDFVTADSHEKRLATLPHSVFGFQKGYLALDDALKDSETEQLLKEYGWEREKRGDDELAWENEISHRYFKVSYRGV